MSLMERLETICNDFNGRIGFHAQNLQTNEIYGFNATTIFPTASVIKLPVLIAMMQQIEDGQYSLQDPIMRRRADQIGGSGILQYLSPGLLMPIRDWAFLMMNISDNLATNVLLDHVGLGYVQNWLRENNYADVEIHRKIDFDALAKNLKDLGTATPAGLTRMITAVFRREVVSTAACDEMMRTMDKVGADRMGRYLPFNPFGELEAEDNKLQLAGKTGSLKGVRAQTAVIWRGAWQEQKGFSITVMTDGNPAPETWSPDAEGTLVIGRVARAIYDHVF